jgi:REP-associated tyrosine transposase
LNPLRAKLVPDLEELDRYRFCGHGVLMGKHNSDWQDANFVLRQFGKRAWQSRKRYREFVEQGIEQGRRPELVGGGLVRSLGRWKAIKTLGGCRCENQR